ncbi:hypothetical protein SAMN05216371_1081 [Streptomyces sp. TLI_053]|uniref:DUF6126 family protein n=1 Tax=Streptomyces sp. TLI_053 TaxID=1855352 RepID=UPI00087AE253|nr:DUF6126 family protein [Streptomyces sp. TLI_053]SDT00686.1 hypothetical protein SAMN05216371_1081 [Streptomyces sp. TLI_053]
MSPDGTTGHDGTAPGSGAAGDDGTTGRRATLEEKARRRAMLIRAGIYIFATHLFAGFVLLLFALGDRK